jgi:hypothetical protein
MLLGRCTSPLPLHPHVSRHLPQPQPDMDHDRSAADMPISTAKHHCLSQMYTTCDLLSMTNFISSLKENMKPNERYRRGAVETREEMLPCNGTGTCDKKARRIGCASQKTSGSNGTLKPLVATPVLSFVRPCTLLWSITAATTGECAGSSLTCCLNLRL